MREPAVFIANRGEIAVRVVRAARAIGIRSVVGFSEPDRNSLAVALADDAICVGPASAALSYLNITGLVSAALATRCSMVHPGFGFLSENADFAAACEDNDVIFLGPTPATISTMGDKIVAKGLADSVGVPILRSIVIDDDVQIGAAIGDGLRYPLLAKAAAGGGGRGMRVVADESELAGKLASASAEALAAFGDGRVFVERYIPVARHVEVQVFGWGDGSVVALGDRDCSTQRRHQKLIEECPAPGIPESVRADLHAAAVRLASAVEYRSAGTVEFIYDPVDHSFAFLEMNTRLQVEHPVTEEALGVDLAAMQLRLALGSLDRAEVSPSLVPSRHSIECRITAEDVHRGFLPSPGTLRRIHWPGGPGIRVDSGVRSGDEISPYYDSMFAKIIATGEDRAAALARMRQALDELEIDGVVTPARFLAYALATEAFATVTHSTTWVETQALPAYQEERTGG